MAALRRFLREGGVSGSPSARDLAEIHRLRERLRAAFAASTDGELVARLSAVGEQLLVRPELKREASGDWRLAISPVPESDLVERVTAISVDQLAGVLTHYGPQRIRRCAADPCTDVFLDTSRNGTRRFCEARCANRFHAAIHRNRTHGGREV